jgi:hypothetical protein
MHLGFVQVAMLGLKKKSPDRAAAHERVRAWTLARFKLADGETS